MRLKTDIIDIVEHILEGKLDKINIEWDKKAAVCVVLASKGYPGNYEKSKIITGLDEAKEVADSFVFHAGTSVKGNNIVTSGGRVLGVTAMGDTIEKAINRAYGVVHMIKFDGMHYRSDIGQKALR